MDLTPDQEIALKSIIEFIYTPIKGRDQVASILEAAAGRGKSFLTRAIVNKVRGTHRIAGVAPTHKARKVLDKFLNAGSLSKVKTMTIASLLNTMRSHSYIGTKHYVHGADSKISLYDLFIIDEASMITDNDVELIMNYALELKRKILFVGDKFQIPNPSQKYLCKGGLATKRDSAAFNVEHKCTLTTNMRQKEGNPIVDLYEEMRLAIAEKREPNVPRKTKMNGSFGVKFYKTKEKWLEEMEKVYLNLDTEIHNVRIIAYTNDTVRNHNLTIRRLFKRGPKPEVGELLMGYNNIGFPEIIIENSQDYYVMNVVHTVEYNSIPSFKNLVGEIVTIKETDTKHEATIFMPDISAPENQAILQELVRRAEKVNRIRSTKEDFKRYSNLKNQLVFMENIYKFGNEIIGEGEFRTGNPLLFKSVNELIEDDCDGDRTIVDNKLSRDITTKYGGLLAERVSDDKPLAGNERLCDRYCVIERDLDYGVCITAHKSQGSNFKSVFVDEADFDKLQDHWNYNISCQVNASKERNQLKYVSFTRPTHSAHIFYRD